MLLEAESRTTTAFDVRCDAALRVLWLPLERTHVARITTRLRAWLAALVLVHLAINCGNVVDGDAVSAKRVGLGRSAVIGKLSEV